MIRSLPLLCLLPLVTSACVLDDEAPPPAPAADNRPDGDATFAVDPQLQEIAARLPPNWSGSGVLVKAEDTIWGAPAWSATRAEIRTQDQQRYLYASNCVTHLTQEHLALSTAQNRARAELTRWLGTERLVGSEVSSNWTGPDHAVCSQVRIPIPEGWQPGDPPPPSTLEKNP